MTLSAVASAATALMSVSSSLSEFAERLTGSRREYFSVNLYRDRDSAVPEDLHRNARMHVACGRLLMRCTLDTDLPRHDRQKDGERLGRPTLSADRIAIDVLVRPGGEGISGAPRSLWPARTW